MNARPRVVHVVDTFGALSETFVYTCVTHHQRFDASVICRARENDAAFPFDLIDVVPEIRTRVHPVRLMSRLLEGTTGRSFWDRRVGAMLADRSPSIVHAHFGQVGVRVMPAVRRGCLPLVTTFYGFDASAFADTAAGRRLLPRLFSAGALFCAEGPHLRQRLIDIGAPTEKTRLLPIPIVISQYPPWQPDFEMPAVVFVGRHVEKKGLADAIRAFSKARRQHPNLRLRIVGDGPERDRARRVAATENVTDAVTWLGYQSHETVINELQRSVLLLQPSLTARDGDSEGGAPTTLLEAQAMGVPVVATRHADIPYVAPEGPGVSLSDERDVAGLAAGICRILAARCGSDPRRVREVHDADAVARTLESYYDEAIAQGLSA